MVCQKKVLFFSENAYGEWITWSFLQVGGDGHKNPESCTSSSTWHKFSFQYLCTAAFIFCAGHCRIDMEHRSHWLSCKETYNPWSSWNWKLRHWIRNRDLLPYHSSALWLLHINNLGHDLWHPEATSPLSQRWMAAVFWTNGPLEWASPSGHFVEHLDRVTVWKLSPLRRSLALLSWVNALASLDVPRSPRSADPHRYTAVGLVGVPCAGRRQPARITQTRGLWQSEPRPKQTYYSVRHS